MLIVKCSVVDPDPHGYAFILVLYPFHVFLWFTVLLIILIWLISISNYLMVIMRFTLEGRLVF